MTGTIGPATGTLPVSRAPTTGLTVGSSNPASLGTPSNIPATSLSARYLPSHDLSMVPPAGRSPFDLQLFSHPSGVSVLNFAKTPMPPSPSFSPTPLPSGTTPIPLISPRPINSTPTFPYLPSVPVDDREGEGEEKEKEKEEEEEEDGEKQQEIVPVKNKRKSRKTKGRKGNEDEEDEDYVERGTRGRRGRGGKQGGQARGRRGRRPAVRDESTMQSPITPSTIYTSDQVKSPPQQSMGMDLSDNSMVSISGKVSPSMQQSTMTFEIDEHDIHTHPLTNPSSFYSLQTAEEEDAEKRKQK